MVQVKFVCSLVKDICDETTQVPSRTLASILLKNTLLSAVNSQSDGWLGQSLSEELRSNIKEAFLNML